MRLEDSPVPFRDGSYDIPASCYTSLDFAAREWEFMWPHVWLLAAHVSDLTAPGDHVASAMGRATILVTRDRAGDIRAFHNICRHRGLLLVPHGSGRNPKCEFTCNYHGWVWGTDGNLSKAPRAKEIPGGLDPSRVKLKEVAVDTYAGFVWVCLGEPSLPLEEYLGLPGRQIAAYKPETFVRTETYTSHWKCNWKVAVEAFSEPYHVAATHPQVADFATPEDGTITYMEPHGRLTVELGVIGPLASEARRKRSIVIDLLENEFGTDTRNVRDDVQAARQLLQKTMRETMRTRGIELEDVSDAQLTDTQQYFLFPNVHLDFHGANSMSIFRYRPHARNPGESYFDSWDLARPNVGRDREPNGDLETVRPIPELPLVVRQDAEIVERIQVGMESGYFEGPLFHQLEGRLLLMHQYLNRFFERGADALRMPAD